LAVRVVTDSTADLPEEIVKDLGITVVPLQVNFGSHTYFDGIDLRADDFYRKLSESETLPTTSQPTPAAFTEVYNRLAKETSDIVSIHISPKLSGTYNSAVLGRSVVERDCRIEIIDSLQASMGLGLIVIQAAKAAQSGATLDEVIDLVRNVIPRIRFFGMVDTLEYLHKGGRIGKAQALMGTLLSIKPLIGCEDGEVHPKGKARTQKKALTRLYEMVQESGEIEELTVSYSTIPEQAAVFTKRLSPMFDTNRVYQARIGPVIGTYLGPGSMAVGVVVRKNGVANPAR